MNDLENLLKHHGVKGMKWGVRKSAVKKSVNKLVSSAKKEIKERKESRDREVNWAKKIKDIDKMSTSEMRTLSNRIRNENDFKRLANNRNLSTSKDRSDYRTRGKLSDQELQNRVEKLRVKDQLRRNISDATKAQRDRGKRIVAIATPLAFQMADGKVDVGNIVRNVKNPDPITKSIRDKYGDKIDKKYGKY